MIVVADDDGHLRAADWADHEARLKLLLDRHYGREAYRLTSARDPGGASAALRRYFKGDIAVIDALPVKTNGTPFQERVWRALRRVACGTTITYTELARRAGRPEAIRAAGTANGQNPVSIVVPCHRVIGSTGYGGGLSRKRWLLAHEGAAPAQG